MEISSSARISNGGFRAAFVPIRCSEIEGIRDNLARTVVRESHDDADCLLFLTALLLVGLDWISSPCIMHLGVSCLGDFELQDLYFHRLMDLFKQNVVIHETVSRIRTNGDSESVYLTKPCVRDRSGSTRLDRLEAVTEWTHATTCPIILQAKCQLYDKKFHSQIRCN